MDQELKDLMKLSDETGIEGAERLAALYKRRSGSAIPLPELTRHARDLLKTKASKQLLPYPHAPRSGGAIAAHAENHTWQIDTAVMTSFRNMPGDPVFKGKVDFFMIAVDVFTRFTRVFPVATVTAGRSASSSARTRATSPSTITTYPKYNPDRIDPTVLVPMT